jgi:hypothetical protein
MSRPGDLPFGDQGMSICNWLSEAYWGLVGTPRPDWGSDAVPWPGGRKTAAVVELRYQNQAIENAMFAASPLVSRRCRAPARYGHQPARLTEFDGRNQGDGLVEEDERPTQVVLLRYRIRLGR